MVRGFRAVAALTAGQLVTCWIRATLSLSEARDTAQRQLDAEQRKKGGQVRAATTDQPVATATRAWLPIPNGYLHLTGAGPGFR